MSTQHTGVPAARRQTFAPPMPPVESRRNVHPRLLVNWRAIATLLYVAFLMLLIGIWIGSDLVIESVQRTTVPLCTNEIADAGGVCVGEPR